MAIDVIDGPVNGGDGIAGSEVGRLEAWVTEYLQQNAKTFFKTIDRWKGQIDIAEIKRLSFRAPALFVTCLGTSGAIDTAAGSPLIDVRFAAAGVAPNGMGADVGAVKDRYQYGVALMGIVLSLLNQMRPPNTRDVGTGRLVPDPRYPWRRASSIGGSNKYSAKLDEMGFSLFEIQWSHKVELGAINLECLPDLVTLFGEVYPDGGTPPVQGEVVYT